MAVILPYFFELDLSVLVGKTILLDLDGTLTADSSLEITDRTKAAVAKLAQKNKILLCSNGRDQDRTLTIAAQLGVEALVTPHRKPSHKLLKYIPNFESASLVVIGDKWLTDGLFARIAQALFIKVRRVIDHKESPKIRIINALDDFVHRLWP